MTVSHDLSNPDLIPQHHLDGNIIIVLDRPQNPANIGAVVRAMKNMAVGTLRLVNPAPFERAELLRYAHRCNDVVDALTVHATLREALADVQFVVGTAALAHADLPQTMDVRTLAADLVNRAAAGGMVALLFGTEADGLDRGALDRCHLLASLPVNPDYPALNLAQSALIFLYELHMARGQPESPSAPPPGPQQATQAELDRLFALTEEVLGAADFFRYNPAMVMRTLRQLTFRAAPSPEDSALLMAILRKLERALHP